MWDQGEEDVKTAHSVAVLRGIVNNMFCDKAAFFEVVLNVCRDVKWDL